MTDESPDLVRKWLASAKPEYPVAILKAESASQIEGFLQLQGFPTAAVIDPNGLVSFAGISWDSEKALESAQAGPTKSPLWPKALAKVNGLLGKDQPQKAYAELVKLLDAKTLSADDQKTAEGFRGYLEGQAGQALTESRSDQKNGYVARAATRLEPYASASPPFPASAECATLLKELQALPDFKKEVSGGGEYDAVDELLGKHKYLEAIQKYAAIGKKYAGTRIGENAIKTAKQMVADGMAGFQHTCMECRKKSRACEKHEKEVKL